MPDTFVRTHLGRPMLHIDGRPHPLPTYSPRGWVEQPFRQATPRFFPHGMGAYFLCVPRDRTAGDYFATPFWQGDTITSQPMGEPEFALDKQARVIREGDPGAYFIVRYGPYEPQSWRDLHRDQLVVNEAGQLLQTPSLASDLYWQHSAQFGRVVIQYCESRPWNDRIIGYWFGLRVEGSHEPLFSHWLFDHSPVMRSRWRQFLAEKYRDVERLRDAHGTPSLTFDNVPLPSDRLRGPVLDVSARLYWLNARENQPLRDYLLLTRDLFHAGFRTIAAAMREQERALVIQRAFLYDAFKQTMAGWDNFGFFAPNESWPLAFAEQLAGAGHIDVADLFGAEGFDGIITPHDYQVRGVGGVFEPEGCIDSAVLRGKIFLCEMDTRTFCGKDHYGRAENLREFEAVTWRNLATALTRGFNAYWMDLHEDWFATPEIHAVIARQVQVIKESLDWPHQDVPGIAVVLDDAAVLETNGNGAVYNETIMWEWKQGLARCGVPHRIYMLQDLELPNFPAHRLFYFPNLHRVDDARLDLLRRRVFRDGQVVLWGPGSGISDGKTLDPGHAQRLTGFSFDFWPVNYPRRTLISRFDHPITAGLPADTVIGSSASYGPLLFPTDGTPLGIAWTKQGRNHVGLACKTMDGWSSVFTAAAPLPAALWRNLARFAGLHVYTEENDILLADGAIVALHSLKSGPRRIALPGRFDVTDVVTGSSIGRELEAITFDLRAPETRVFRLVQPAPGHA